MDSTLVIRKHGMIPGIQVIASRAARTRSLNGDNNNDRFEVLLGVAPNSGLVAALSPSPSERTK